MDGPDDLYDQYVEAALAGEVEAPEDFCARVGGVPAELRARLDALFRLLHTPAPAAAKAPAGRAPEPGLPRERVGDFRLLRRIGAGGMGIVYLAEQESLKRLVALKLLRPELAGSPTAAERLRREAHAIAKLRHPNIVEVHGFGEDEGTRYCAMELVPGESLADRLRAARAAGIPPPVADVLRFLEPIARALDHAHRAGVLHRDVKPSNLRLTPDGRALLVDFGLARELDSDAPTLTEQFAGSPAYASPEQIAGRREQVGPQSDLWSLGVTLYEALTLTLPFGGEDLPRLLQRVLHEAPAPLRKLRPEIPRDLEQVVLQCLEKEPARRYATAGELADDLLAVLELKPVRARAPGPLERARRWLRTHRPLAAAAATLLVAFAAALVWRGIETRSARRAQQQEAASLVGQARELMTMHVREDREVAELETALAKVAKDAETNYVPPERARLLDREGELRARRRELSVRTRRIEQLLLQAERLDPTTDVRALRSELYLGEWRAARGEAAESERTFLAGLVRDNDPEGQHAAEIAGTTNVTIATDPPGAAVFLFRYQPQSELFAGGEFRLVPCPFGQDVPAVAPGTFALRVTQDQAGFLAEEVIVEVGGRPVASDVPGRAALERALRGGPARVVRRGRPATTGVSPAIEEVELPPGLKLRPTAAPLLVTASSCVGTTPIERLDLPWGSYLVLLCREGHAPVRARLSVQVDRQRALAIPLPHLDEQPPDCAFIANPFYSPAPFWMRDTEVTAGEWLEFVNDPKTLAEIDRSLKMAKTTLVPRRSDERGVWWPRITGAGFGLPADWTGDWPVVGVSFEDAQRFVTWKNEVASLTDIGLEWALPTADEWRDAAHGHFADFVWGASFRSHWCNSCYATTHPGLVAVASYPVDESGYGVLDLAGGASEWCESWYDDPAKGWRWVAGGNWGNGSAGAFHAEAAIGQPPSAAAGVFGVRLIARSIGSGR